MKKLPNKKYSIIYADPPWQYRDKALAGNRGAGCKYETQTPEYLSTIDVKSIADKNCILFMWVTMPQLPVGLQLISDWGFTFKTNAFTWIKRNKVAKSLFWGMGGWTRANAEICLLATIGKPKRTDAGVHSVIISRIEKHSKKPDQTRDRIVKLCGDLPRIELFARQKSMGWDAWGDQIGD